MNYLDTLDLEEMKRAGYKTDRERVLLEALAEETAVKDALTGIFNDYPRTDDIRPDLERIKDTLGSLRKLADKEAEDWFQDTNTPAPRLDATEAPERLAAVCLRLSDLFSNGVMDFRRLEALTTAGEVYEIAERANVAVYA